MRVKSRLGNKLCALYNFRSFWQNLYERVVVCYVTQNVCNIMSLQPPSPNVLHPLSSEKRTVLFSHLTSFKMTSAAFSLMMNVGRTGKAPGTRGNALASTTLKFFTPLTRKFKSRTAILSSSAPIAQLLEI
jgi:hypothetical protein